MSVNVDRSSKRKIVYALFLIGIELIKISNRNLPHIALWCAFKIRTSNLFKYITFCICSYSMVLFYWGYRCRWGSCYSCKGRVTRWELKQIEAHPILAGDRWARGCLWCYFFILVLGLVTITLNTLNELDILCG